MKISLGCDHGGYALKEHIKAYLESKGHEVVDCGTYSTDSCDYPIFGEAAARKVQSGECERGIVICTTGIGISIAANKVRGIRCALCSEPLSAEMTRVTPVVSDIAITPPPQQRQYARHGRRHDRQKYGRAHR